MELIILIGVLIVLGFWGWRFLRRQGFQPAQKPVPQKESRGEELPLEYGQDKLVLLVRDPNTLFAYWEVSATTRESFHSQYGPRAWLNSQPVLKVHQLDSPQGKKVIWSTDIRMDDLTDNWYLQLNKPSSTFFADLGRLMPDGSFALLLRSNLVTTPSDRVSAVIDPLWPPLEGIWGYLGWPEGEEKEGSGDPLSSIVLVSSATFWQEQRARLEEGRK